MSQAEEGSDDQVRLDSEQLPVGPELKLGPFTLKSTRLEINGLPELKDWEGTLNTLIWFSKNTPWWIGDLIKYGEARFGEGFYNTITPDPTTADMIGRHAAVARAFPVSQRDEELSWTHHREVTRLKPQERKLVFEYAKKRGIASGKMRDAVRVIKARRQSGDED
jgi:hypothetical protein